MQLKLQPSKEMVALLDFTMREYISLVNDIADYIIVCGRMPKLSSAMVKAPLPSALKSQCCLDAKSIYTKVTKKGSKHKGKLPILKKPVAIWNNQNYEVGADYIAMPFFVDGKVHKTKIPAIVPTARLKELKVSKLGTLRITKKGSKYIAQIAYEQPEPESLSEGNVMGVDLGLKCPAVAVTSTGTTAFYGNGRENKFVRRKYNTRRKKLGKAKKLRAIRKSRNKEQRWMRDRDHKVSRAIVNDAIRQRVSAIKLEALAGIRKSARTSRKNNHELHSWSFYRLANFIEYKAKLAGINVVYVDPAYTSQTCPHCGARHHARDRLYICSDCGYSCHRDRVGALNILNA